MSRRGEIDLFYLSQPSNPVKQDFANAKQKICTPLIARNNIAIALMIYKNIPWNVIFLEKRLVVTIHQNLLLNILT